MKSFKKIPPTPKVHAEVSAKPTEVELYLKLSTLQENTVPAHIYPNKDLKHDRKEVKALLSPCVLTGKFFFPGAAQNQAREFVVNSSCALWSAVSFTPPFNLHPSASAITHTRAHLQKLILAQYHLPRCTHYLCFLAPFSEQQGTAVNNIETLSADHHTQASKNILEKDQPNSYIATFVNETST